MQTLKYFQSRDQERVRVKVRDPPVRKGKCVPVCFVVSYARTPHNTVAHNELTIKDNSVLKINNQLQSGGNRLDTVRPARPLRVLPVSHTPPMPVDRKGETLAYNANVKVNLCQSQGVNYSPVEIDSTDRIQSSLAASELECGVLFVTWVAMAC